LATTASILLPSGNILADVAGRTAYIRLEEFVDAQRSEVVVWAVVLIVLVQAVVLVAVWWWDEQRRRQQLHRRHLEILRTRRHHDGARSSFATPAS
jgi:hypothetical protein